ncbi:PREDICTED: keratin-associated protein 5-9 [Tarenaya hassleriana]|uniref:keratin-associated protein 5-9 n=1 Tax=Tarenaya hassleriana TaxID=28532 RepID=UPI00053C2C21|nr:PREDICTED: keratin-associated protein 5-9 [Tarenaya hassleriana]
MANLKFVVVLGLLFTLSVAVLSETSKYETQVQKVNPTDTAVEPQQVGCGCGRRGCCGSCAFGQCSACCPRKMAGAEESGETVVEPQQGGCGWRGCCGPCAFGRCSACCPA